MINQLHWLSKIRSFFGSPWGNEANKEFDALGTQGEFIKDGRRDFSWITKPPSDRPYQKSESGNFAYIADEPGYRLSYHGKSAISFPKEPFAEMVESKRDKVGVTMDVIKDFNPNRTAGSEIEIDKVDELSTEEWYYIRKKGDNDANNNIRVQHESESWYSIWGLEPPYDVNNAASTYMIYTPGYGLINGETKGWNFIENMAPINDWKFSNNGRDFSVINKKENRSKFPAVLVQNKNRIQPEIPKTQTYNQDIKVTFTERNLTLFDSEKVYTITSPDKTQMVDYVIGKTPEGKTEVYSSNKWYIQKEGRFYRIISGHGKTLYFGTAAFGANKWKLAMIENGPFPARGVTDAERKHYYQRLWNITATADGGYKIQNAFKVQHHFEFTKKSKVRYMHDDTGGVDADNEWKIREENFIDGTRSPQSFKITEVK